MIDDPGGVRRASGECGENAAPYVLGALDDHDRRLFRAHLESCAVCREEVEALRQVTRLLPGAAPYVPAPRSLKRSVMRAVRADVRSRRGERRASRAPHRLRFALGAGAALLIVVALLALTLRGGRNARTIRAQVDAPGASGYVRLSGGHAQLTLNRMPGPGSGRVYEVWLERAGPPQPTDVLFGVTAAGRATVAVPGSVAGVRAILVTSEPEGGSRVPTRAPAFVARLL
jgi:anti-sigma-K factor RskA